MNFMNLLQQFTTEEDLLKLESYISNRRTELKQEKEKEAKIALYRKELGKINKEKEMAIAEINKQYEGEVKKLQAQLGIKEGDFLKVEKQEPNKECKFAARPKTFVLTPDHLEDLFSSLLKEE